MNDCPSLSVLVIQCGVLRGMNWDKEARTQTAWKVTVVEAVSPGKRTYSSSWGVLPEESPQLNCLTKGLPELKRATLPRVAEMACKQLQIHVGVKTAHSPSPPSGQCWSTIPASESSLQAWLRHSLRLCPSSISPSAQSFLPLCLHQPLPPSDLLPFLPDVDCKMESGNVKLKRRKTKVE